MTSFEDALAAQKSSGWQKDSLLVVKPESLQFTTDTSLKSRALGFAQLLLQDTGLDKTKKRSSPSKSKNDNAYVEETERNGLNTEDQELEQKKGLSEEEATGSENTHKDDFEELDVSQSSEQQKIQRILRQRQPKTMKQALKKHLSSQHFLRRIWIKRYLMPAER